MLTEPGKYWLDFSLFAEYSASAHGADSDSVTIGGLFQKQDMKWLHTLNVYWEKDVGSKAVSPADGFQYAWQTRYLLDPLFQPGIEIYGQMDDLSHPGPFNQQQLRACPMFAGSYGLGEILGRENSSTRPVTFSGPQRRRSRAHSGRGWSWKYRFDGLDK